MNRYRSSTPVVSFCIHQLNLFDSTQLPIFISSRDKPLHLLNGLNGAVHYSYSLVINESFMTAFDMFQVDNFLFSSTKSTIYKININDSSDLELINLKGSQRGIIASIDINQLYIATGDLSNTLAIYSMDMHLMLLLTHLPQPVIQVKWLSDALVCVNFRNYDWLYIYDINDPSAPVNYLYRPCSTNQNIYFDIFSEWLITGDSLGHISFFSTSKLTLDCSVYDPTHHFRVSSDTINSVAHHPQRPLLILSSNSRKFHATHSSDSSDSDNDSVHQVEHSLSHNLMLFSLQLA